MTQKSFQSINRECMGKLRKLPLPQALLDEARRMTLPAAYRLTRLRCIQFPKTFEERYYVHI